MPRKTQTEQSYEDRNFGRTVRRHIEVAIAHAKLKGLYELRDQTDARMDVLRQEMATGIPTVPGYDPLQDMDVYAHRL